MLIHLENISYAYPNGPPVLENLDFQLRDGQKIGLVGPNGCGKTTFFHIIMGLLKPTSGSIEIFDKQITEEKDFVSVRKKIGLLFQDADDQLFSPTVLEDVAFGPLNLGKNKEEAKAIAGKTLDTLGLTALQDRITYKLSGGEKRLVSLATVLAMEPQVLLLDEPTSGLDEETKKTLLRVLTELNLAIVLISHEFDFLSEITRSIHAMEGGRIRTDLDVHVHFHKHAHVHGDTPHKHK